MRPIIASVLGKLRRQPREWSGSGSDKSCAGPVHRRLATIPVLVASPREEDHRRVRELVANSQWLAIEARDWSGALNLSRYVVFPVIVCDRDLGGLETHTAIRSLAGGWRTACVILLSDYWDPDLWEGLLQQGGFDVLVRPLHRDDVVAVLDAAYRQWADVGPSQAVSNESSRSTLTRSRAAS